MKIEIQNIPWRTNDKVFNATEIKLTMGDKELVLPINTDLIDEKNIISRVEDFVSQYKVKMSINSEMSKGYYIKDE
jgi:hypothetical protein